MPIYNGSFSDKNEPLFQFIDINPHTATGPKTVKVLHSGCDSKLTGPWGLFVNFRRHLLYCSFTVEPCLPRTLSAKANGDVSFYVCFFFKSPHFVIKETMGKKRAKDKSSREEDDIDLSGKEFSVLVIMATCCKPLELAETRCEAVNYVHFSFS